MSPRRRKKMRYLVYKPVSRPNKSFPWMIQLLSKDVRKNNVFSPKLGIVIRVLSRDEIEVEINGRKTRYRKEGEYVV